MRIGRYVFRDWAVWEHHGDAWNYEEDEVLSLRWMCFWKDN